MLDPRFTCYSPRSRRLADVVDHAELLAEIRRTLDALASGAPAMIAKGTLTEDQSKAVMFLWLAIANDLEVEQQWLIEARAQGDSLTWTVGDRIRLRGDDIAWADKVEALQREIINRRATYPADVDKGRLAPTDARAQLERLEAVHALYLRLGFAFDGPLDDLLALSRQVMDAAVEQDGAAEVQSSGDSSRVEHPASSREDGGATPPPRSIAGATA